MGNFPRISRIEDVLPHVKDIDSFIVMEKDYGTVIDYAYMESETFDGDVNSSVAAQIKRECRGISFDKQGNITSRPFHKFFNVGEREETLVENINWSRPHLVMDKLDGSMIRSIYTEDGFRLGTRAGVTGHSVWAEEYMVSCKDILYRQFMDAMENINYTPCFEFFSRRNMIVLDYGKSFMKLLACREKTTGEYMRYDEMTPFARSFNVPYVEQIAVDLSDPSDFLSRVKSEKEVEGYVIRFDDGQTVKIKGEWYVQLHHLVSGLNAERNIVRHLLDNDLDDVLPMLPKNRREELELFSEDFWKFYKEFKKNINAIWNRIQSELEDGYSRKDIAMKIQQQDKAYQGIMFRFIDADEDSREDIIRDVIHRACNKEISFNEFMDWAKK